MKIVVQYFDDERLKKDWDSYELNPITFIDGDWIGKVNPLDYNWSKYFSEKEIETERYERFLIDSKYNKDFNFIRIDNDYIYDDSYHINDNEKIECLYLWSEMKRAEAILNELRLKCDRDEINWFTDVTKIINRDKMIEEILNKRDDGNIQKS